MSLELVRRTLGSKAAFSPIVTLEPRRRKFHKPITMTLPVPETGSDPALNGFRGDAPSLRLLCSITGKHMLVPVHGQVKVRVLLVLVQNQVQVLDLIVQVQVLIVQVQVLVPRARSPGPGPGPCPGPGPGPGQCPGPAGPGLGPGPGPQV
jgi:hypothetical protein